MIPRLGDWRFNPADRLGGGGYAQAYRCQEGASGSIGFAIKVFDDPNHANTFEREVAALGIMMGCPGTPALVDHGRLPDGRLCIVTELAPGIRLDKRIRTKGPLGDAEARSLIGQLLAVLRHAHERGLLHKDIKASNVLIDRLGHPPAATLLDWGVAELVGDGRGETIRAKQDYVAPECYYGRHGVATDFYSLGWLAVEALTGRRPYHLSDNREADYAVAAHCLERVDLPDTLPPAWRPLLLNWVARRPEARLVRYDLDAAMADAAGSPSTEAAGLDYRNIGRMCGYLEQAARAGVPYAQHELAARRIEAGRIDEAVHWLELAAESGYARSACRLAQLLDGGADPARVERLLAEAAAVDAQARYLLAMRRPRDDAEGRALLKRAADAGQTRAQLEYAERIEAASGDLAEAVEYYGRAADRGNARARRRFDALRRVGPAVPQQRGDGQ